jgi:AsmA protein
MTDRRPPPSSPPPLPPLDSYRPRKDLPPHAQGAPPQAARPQQKFPPRPLPAGVAPRRVDSRGRLEREDGEGMGVLGYVGLALLAVVLLAGAGVGYLLLKPPVDLIQRQLVAEVKAKTGRDLKIGGPVRFKLFPALAVSMAKAELSAAPGMTGPPLITASEIDLGLNLVPLLGRRIDVERLVLRNPVIEFRTDKSGRRSWDLADAAGIGARRVELAQVTMPNRATDAPTTTPARIGSIEDVAIDNVRIQNGTVSWSDERTGARETLSAVNLDADMRSIAGPLELSGNLVVRGEKLDLTAALTSLKTMLDGKPAKLTLNTQNRHANVVFDGTLASGAAPGANGALTVKSPSVRGLAKLLGADLPPGAGGGSGSLTGKLRTGPPGAAVDDMTLTLDGATATGNIGLETQGPRPLLRANLKLSDLDLNKYLAAAEATAAPPPAPAPAPAPPKAAPAVKGAEAPASIDDLLNRPGPRVKGFAQRAGWSEERIDTAALGAFDADVKLQTARFAYRELKTGPARLAATLKNRVLAATFEDVQAYEGRGHGTVTIDAAGDAPRLSASIAADGMAMLPLLKDAARTGWLSGTGKLTLNVAGQGVSQKAVMDSLEGKAEVTLNNGAIAGWNVAQIIRGLKQGQLSGFDRNETAKTDFSELASSWKIAQGVAQNQDLRMTSPLLRVTGSGRVALGARQIDYQLRPKVVASLDGQGGAQGLAGLEVPLRIRGSWDRPEIVPEVGDLLKDPDKALGAIKELGKQFKGKKPNEIVDQVLGKNPEAAKKANDLLDKFLKPRKEAAPAQ